MFGNGTFGGVTNSTTKRARFDGRSGSIEQTIGTWKRYRTQIDVNMPVNDWIALRTAAVYLDRDGYRYKEFEKNRAAFLTSTFKITKKTTLRVEGEYGEQTRNIPQINITDKFSGWDGISTFSGRLDVLPADANARGISARPANYNVYVPGAGKVMNYAGDPITIAGGTSATTPIGPYTFGTTLPSAGFSVDDVYLLNQINITPQRFDRAIAGSNFRLPGKTYTMASDAPIYQNRYRDFQATLNQDFGPVFIELAVDKNYTNQETKTIDVRDINRIFIDINRIRPDGSTNPLFLQPYADGTLRRNPFSKEVTGYRAAVGSQKDLGRWGKYTASLLGGFLEQQDQAEVFNLSLQQSADHRAWGATGTSILQSDLIKVRRLLYQTSRPISIPATVQFVDPINGVNKQVTPVWTQENDRADSYQYIHNRYTYGMLAFQAKYWNERIILLGAFRQDKFRTIVRQGLQAGDYPANWDGKNGIFRLDGPADYAALVYTPKDAAGNPTGGPRAAETRPRAANGDRLSQYANDRFKDDYNAPEQKANQGTKSLGAIFHPVSWLSPYFNYAETFNPPNPIQKLDSSFLPPTLARGTDVGARFSLLGGRIVGSVDYYRNYEKNAAGSGGIQTNVNNILRSRAYSNLAAGRNVRGEPDVPLQSSDVQDRYADGYEFELTANITKNWRGIFNFGIPNLYTENGNQFSLAYLKVHDSVLKQIVVDSGGIIDSGTNIAAADPNISVSTAPDQSMAVNAYNALQQQVRGFTTARSLSTASKSANIYTDYAFREGVVKGLRVGAGVQWRQARVIGNRSSDTIVNPANPSQAMDDPTLGPNNYVRAPHDDWPVTVNIAYATRVKGHQVTYSLRVLNALNQQDLIYNAATLRPLNGDYTSPARKSVPSNYVLRDPISFEFKLAFAY